MDALDEFIAKATNEVGKNFRCFGGGGIPAGGHPIAVALSSQPLQFALGVDVRSVVEFIVNFLTDEMDRKS